MAACRLVTCSASGYGSAGAYRDAAAGDPQRRLDLQGQIAGQGRGSHRQPGVAAGVAEDLHDQGRDRVDDAGVPGEAGDGVDDAVDPQHPRDGVECPEDVVHGGEQVRRR